MLACSKNKIKKHENNIFLSGPGLPPKRKLHALEIRNDMNIIIFFPFKGFTFMYILYYTLYIRNYIASDTNRAKHTIRWKRVRHNHIILYTRL